MGNWVWLIYIVIIGGFIYLMMIRPNQKRAAEQKTMMDAIQPGARVMLTSGLFGTIQAVGDQQMVVELAPGMAVTIVKQAVAKVVPESEEEFEYTDEHEQIEGDAGEPSAIEAAKTDVDEASSQAETASEDDTIKPAEAPDFEPPADEAKPAPRTGSKK
ncbi:MAG: preprotein translocase subunit YajC [Propionibacteriaceae bacterium]|nr:preprotein translocase subunit YajC [Propionibacteriaceae bacterium]